MRWNLASVLQLNGVLGQGCDSFLPAQNTLGTLKLSSDDMQLKISVLLGLAKKYSAQIYNPLVT